MGVRVLKTEASNGLAGMVVMSNIPMPILLYAKDDIENRDPLYWALKQLVRFNGAVWDKMKAKGWFSMDLSTASGIPVDRITGLFLNSDWTFAEMVQVCYALEMKFDFVFSDGPGFIQVGLNYPK